MKRICMGLTTALAFAVFGTTTALAQQPTPSAKVSPDDNKTRYKVTLIDVDQPDVQEDVEILRRLLDKSFTAVYGPLLSPKQPIAVFGNSNGGMSGSMPGMSSNYAAWKNIQQEAAPLTEGVYLKDYGVVYTVTLPPPPNKMLPGPTAGVVTQTPLSPWERTRKELRGEKIEDPNKPVGGSPSLAEVILKVLADNGKHFTSLTESERITVVVTLRDNGVYQPTSTVNINPIFAMPVTSMPGGPAGMSQLRGSGLEGTMMRSISVSDGAPSSPKAPPPATGDDAPWVIDVRNNLTLGDLHLKKENTAGAIAAYNNAQEELELATTTKTAGPGDPVEVLLTALPLYLRLAKGYVSAGDKTSFRKAIQRVGELSKTAAAMTGEAQAMKVVTAPPPSPSAALPSKLIVSASKKLLAEVGSSLTFEAFVKAATVETVAPMKHP